MKYVLMFTSDPALDAQQPPERMEEDLGRILQWFTDHEAAIVDGGAALAGVESATTVRHRTGEVVVVDGPFSEAREVVGGFTIIDVPDLDAAVALARSWPSLELPGNAVEIRPVIDDDVLFG